jgi:aspartate ammonia-lyase
VKVKQGRSVKEIALERGLLKPEDLERIFDPKNFLGKRAAERHRSG